MAYLDPNEAFDNFRDRTLEAIKKQFPIDGRNQVLELQHLEVHDDKSPDDLRGQQHAKVNGETWGVPVIAHLVLRDKATGKELSKARTRIAELPKITRRHSQIVGGQEYQVDNQWQLKPGAYVRRRQTGEIETNFQSSRAQSFDVTFDDEKKEFRLDYGKARLPLYPILQTLGVSDAELEKAWGKDILKANQSARKIGSTVTQFYKTTRRAEPPSEAEAVRHMIQVFKNTNLRPESTAVTLGKEFDHVNGDALTRATKKMLAVQNGAAPDDRDSLIFKDLRSVGDFAHDKIMAASSSIRAKMQRKINTAESPRDALRFEVFDKPIRETFHKNSAAQVAKQVNPVEMVSTAQQTTVMGPGGIQSEQQILDEVKFVNPSHMAFLDPIHTPEGGKTGITLRMPIGVKKVGNEPQVPLFNLKSGKMEYVGPTKFLQSKVVLPDQVEWHGDKPTPKSSTVKWSNAGDNDIAEGSFKDADYVMRHPSQFFNVTSNLIPFINNTSGGRASMATRHMEQAISLVHREAPLVQVSTGAARGGRKTFEEIIGTQASHQSPVDGVVHAVKNDAIIVASKDGKHHEVQIYRNYPLNDAKSVLDSTSLVAVGDKVKSGQTIADTNYSKNGAIALGTNLRVGYIPYKGYNFEDGIVISDSAAKKLSSVHLYKHNLPVDDDTVLAKKRYMAQHPGLYKRDQLEHIDDDGLVKKGTRVMPGDPLVLSMKKSNVQDRVGLSAIRKSLGEQYSDRSLTWDGEVPGEVVGAFRKDGEVVVHVKAIEPMQVGDKLAGRYGNKGIVTKIVADHEMPHTPDGRHIEVALNPSGVPGRMNIGQVLETAASKIAEKTGKTYLVQNFNGENQLEKVRAELKQHGISDTEELRDPVTKQRLGVALVGNQHMIKLHHQVDKKVSVRSGMNLPGGDVEKYDINLQPSGGGHSGGQSMDPLGLYALLAHGARANIREMQTWKSEGPDPNASPQKQWQSQHHDVWDAIQHGDPLPTPKPTFAFKKFTDMLTGMGINMDKKGHEFVLSPLTDKQIKDLSGDRVLTKPAELLYAKVDPKTGDPRPKPGGLFDEKLTGGHGGRKWSRIELSEPVPNPVFEDSIRMITGLSEDEYTGLVHGTRALSSHGKIVELGHGVTGGAAVKQLLERVDVDKELTAARKELSTVPSSKVDKVLKKVKRLQALQDAGLHPSEAYILHNLPVLPPALRPVTVMQDGNFNFADINQLYSQFAQNNDQMRDPTLMKNLTDANKSDLRKNLYDGVKAIMGVGIPYNDAQHKGLLHQIHGAQPKTGYFQSTLISRKQDMSMRSTIVPEPSLSLDEVGLPKEHAMKLFAPFVVNQLKKSGVAENVAEAQKMVAAGGAQAQRALQRVLEERPVMLKRDPALHKYSVQAFKPRLVDGNAIKIHPLVTGGYNADFDGDCTLGEVLVATTAPMRDKDSEGVSMPHTGQLFSYTAIDLADFPRIEESARTTARGNIVYAVPPGTYVPAYAQGLFSMSEVTEYSVHPNCEEWIVKTKRGRELVVSSDHSLALLDHDSLEVKKAVPRESVGEWLPTLRMLEEGPAPISTLPGALATNPRALSMLANVPMTFDVGWFIGATAGDGWVSWKGSVSKRTGEITSEARAVCFSYGHAGHAVTAKWNGIGGWLANNPHAGDVYMPHEYDGFDCESFRSTISSTSLGLWLEPLIGKGAANKHLPDGFLHLPLDCRRGLLCGLIDTDGTCNWSNRTEKKAPQFSLAFSTTSTAMATCIQLLGLSLGLVSGKTPTKTQAGNEAWVITFSTRTVQEATWISLTHPDKKAALERLQVGATVGHGRSEQVPLPDRACRELLDHLRAIGASKKGKNRNADAFSAYIVLNRSEGGVTRIIAERMRALLAQRSISAYLETWFNLVCNKNVGWDQIESAQATGEYKTMYDLTVPGPWTFTMINGAAVWDTMSVFVPISDEAVHEARKMFPSNNLFSEASGRVMYQPTLESALGLYKLTRVTEAKGGVHDLKHPADAIVGVQKGKYSVNDKVQVDGKTTTAGRILIAAALPQPMQHKVLHDLDFKLDKKGLDKLLTQVASEHTGDFGSVADKLKDIGNGAASGLVTVQHSQFEGAHRLDPAMHVHVPVGVHTLALEDFTPDVKTRESILSVARREAAGVKKDPKVTGAAEDRELVRIWADADRKMKDEHLKKTVDKPNNLMTMHLAGVKPGWGQYKQMTLAPMLVEDAAGRIIPTPITKSYAEGLDTGEYWTQMHGARRGAVMKVQQVRDPGYMSKLLMANTMDMLVTGEDCGTARGIAMPITDREVHDRILQKEFSSKGMTVPAGTVLTPNIVSKMRAVDKNAQVLVRSPLKCEHAKGICQKCAGLAADGHMHQIGENLGVTAAQTLGERAMQLTMRVFHTGGAVDTSGGSKILGSFDRFSQLMSLPKNISDASTLAMRSGTIEKVEKNPTGVTITIGGKKHHVGKDSSGRPLWTPDGEDTSGWVPPKVGMKVEKGQILSDPRRTLVNPHDLYKATNSIESVQNYLADEVYGLYKDEGVKRQHVETVVKAMSNLTKIDAPGDYEGVLRGEFHPTSKIHAINRTLVREGKTPIEHTPVLKGVEMMPLSLQEDWLAKLQHIRLKSTILDAAATGGRSNLHGPHPVPGIAYGAEFGLNKDTIKGRPALSHLQDVAGHNY